MSLRFAGKGPHSRLGQVRLGGTMVATASSLALSFACATGDSPLDPTPDGAQAQYTDAASPPMTESGPSDEQTSSDDAAPTDDTTVPPNGDSSSTPDVTPPQVDAVSDSALPVDATGSETGAEGGIPCGAGPSPALRCTGAHPVCCETSNTGGVTYACVASGGCTGYAITCGARRDCGTGAWCCHYNSSIKCEPTCPIASAVCDPSDPTSCGTGHTCTVQLVLSGSTSSLLTCSP
jgi:hypothetical protein